jgi:tRNA 2-thiouridine synthesizing protein E
MSTAENLDFETLSDGRLANLNDWNEGVASELASHDAITLNADHWLVINTMRDYYKAFNVSPVNKLLKRELNRRSNSDQFSDEYLAELFPNGVLLQGSKIAGIPRPYLDAELEKSTYKGKANKSENSHFDKSFEFEGKEYEVTTHGNLVDLHKWSSHLANYMAQQEGIELSKDHWEVIEFLREFYFTYGISPMVKIIMKHIAEDIGKEKSTREYLYSLFPKGPARQGSRIAGLPEPQGCIDFDE